MTDSKSTPELDLYAIACTVVGKADKLTGSENREACKNEKFHAALDSLGDSYGLDCFNDYLDIAVFHNNQN